MAHKILVAVDGSDASERALQYAAKMALDLADTRLTLFHVGEPLRVAAVDHDRLPGDTEIDRTHEVHSEEIDTYEAKEEQQDAEMFRYLRYRAQQLGLKPEQVETKLANYVENVSDEIISEAEEGDYEAICLGRQGRSSVKDYFIGSVSERVVRHARGCAVWIVE